MRRFNKMLFWVLACYLVIGGWGIIYAQNTGKIAGTITDAQTNDNLPGANVFLEGTKIGTTSDRFGMFYLSNIPFGKYTLVVQYVGYQEFKKEITLSDQKPAATLDIKLKVTAIPGEEIEVVSYVHGQMKAMSQQLNAPNITNVLSREEMERFPDLNTAEVLQRIPGVAIQRSLGEGRFVYLRGTEPRLTTVQVDGQSIASPQDEERFVGLDVINTGQLAYMEVIKAITPDMDGDAIGGIVNLISHSAFDYKGRHLDVDLGSGYSYLAGKPIYRGSLTYSNIFGSKSQFGLTFNANWYRNNIVANSDEMDWGDEEDTNGNTIPFALRDFRLFNYNTTRDHYGLSTTLEYKLNEKNQFFIKGMFNQRNDDQLRNMVRYRVSKGDYLDATTVSKARLAYEMQARDEIQKIYSISAGGKHEFGPAHLDYSIFYSYGDETKKNPGQIKSEFQLDEKVDLKLNLTNVDFPGIKTTNLDQAYILDPAHWEIDNQDYKETFTSNKKTIGDINFSYPATLGNLFAKIKIGGKFKLNEKDRDSKRWKYKWKGDQDILMSNFVKMDKIDDFLLGHYTFGPVMNTDNYWSFFNKYRAKDDGLREYIRLDDTDGAGGKYNATEDIYAAYAMASFDLGKFNLLLGARDEFTKTSYKGFELLYDNNGDFVSMKNVKQTNSYNNVLPALHVRYRLNPLTNLRFAVTTGIARPNYFDLAPYQWVFPENQEVLKGNPDLRPTSSLNLDFMFEHYFTRVGGVSIGIFYKNMKDIIYHNVVRQQGGTFDGYFVEQPINGGDASLTGVEVGFTQQLTFLPGVLSGIGIFGNYTYTKSKANLTYRPNYKTLPGQAADVGNLGISYDKFGLTARLSLNYTSELLYKVGDNPDFDRYTDKRAQIDFSASYEVIKGLSVYLQMINLSNAPSREYFGVPDRPRLNQYQSWWMRSGIKFKM